VRRGRARNAEIPLILGQKPAGPNLPLRSGGFAALLGSRVDTFGEIRKAVICGHASACKNNVIDLGFLVACNDAGVSDVTFALDRGRPLGAIIVGRAGIDLYPLPDKTKIEAADNFGAEIGGSAGNIAVALTRQGIRAALVSPISGDPVGRFVRAALSRYAVDTGHCRAVAGDYRTSLALAETRAEDCEVVIYRNGAADLQLQKDDFDLTFISSASVLVVTGTALAAEPSRGAAIEALARARAANTFTILDIDHRPYSWPSAEEAMRLYASVGRKCNAIVGNDDEFSVIAGSGSGALAAAARFVEDGCDFAIFKRGAAGSVTITADTTFELGIFPVEVRKPFGAGDAFLGCLIASLLHGLRLEPAVTRASAAAAYVVSRRGCASAMPTRGELESFIASHRVQ
jgi:5-dehydro-2-deoxygluconokinase